MGDLKYEYSLHHVMCDENNHLVVLCEDGLLKGIIFFIVKRRRSHRDRDKTVWGNACSVWSKLSLTWFLVLKILELKKMRMHKIMVFYQSYISYVGLCCIGITWNDSDVLDFMEEGSSCYIFQWSLEWVVDSSSAD